MSDNDNGSHKSNWLKDCISFLPRSVSIVDYVIGKHIKRIRLMFGLSQEEFAKILNVSSQQVQKYENGSNRLSASSMWMLSYETGVSVSTFFAGLDGEDPEFMSEILGAKSSFSLKENSSDIDYSKVMKSLAEDSSKRRSSSSGVDRNIVAILKAYNSIDSEVSRTFLADTIIALADNLNKKK